MEGKIPKGYKQTEIGIIPEDWEVDKICSFASITTGARNTQDKIDDGDYPFFVRSQNVERINSYSFDGEAVLTAGDGVGTGKVFHYIIGKFDFHQRVYKISNFSARVDGYYFYLYFSNHFLDRIIQMTAKSSVDSVRMEMIANMQVPFPPTKEEQSAIAQVLSDMDALIENLDKLIAKKKLIKKRAMQELLTGKRRLPGFSGKWEVKKLGEIGKFKGGSGFPIKYQGKAEGTYPFYKVSDMNNDGNQIFMREANNWIDENTKKTIEANIFPKHTIVFAKIGAAIYLERKKILSLESCIDNNMMGFIFDEDLNDYRFLYYLFLSIRLGRLVSATALPSLNGKQIAGLSFAFPKKPEQSAIALVLSDMDAEIEVLEKKRDKYKLTKQGAMQLLLMGKVRLV